jgi:hypothetical protein
MPPIGLPTVPCQPPQSAERHDASVGFRFLELLKLGMIIIVVRNEWI